MKVHVARGWVNGIVVHECHKRHRDLGSLYFVRVPEGYGWAINSLEECAAFPQNWGVDLEINKRIYWCAYSRDLKALKQTEDAARLPKHHIIIEITDEGATAKYIVGKKVEKTSAVKRYSYDKLSDKAAAYYAVCKLFGGDLSEVVEKLTAAVASADKARDLLVDLIKGN